MREHLGTLTMSIHKAQIEEISPIEIGFQTLEGQMTKSHKEGASTRHKKNSSQTKTTLL